jgi:hypothetical protein
MTVPPCPPAAPPHARRVAPGYTIIEVVLAAIFLSLIVAGAGRMMYQSAQLGSVEYHRSAALAVLRTEIDLLHAAGPLAAHTDTFAANAAGERTVNGPYQVQVQSDFRCDGGAYAHDNQLAADTMPYTCGNGQRPTRYFTVIVRYPDRQRGDSLGGVVATQIQAGAAGTATGALAHP